MKKDIFFLFAVLGLLVIFISGVYNIIKGEPEILGTIKCFNSPHMFSANGSYDRVNDVFIMSGTHQKVINVSKHCLFISQ